MFVYKYFMMDAADHQNEKYELHTRKLTDQVVTLNDSILELQQKNMKLATNLKYRMEQQEQQLLQQRSKETSSKQQSSTTVTTKISSQKANTLPNSSKLLGETGNRTALATNHLTMEDEEGEIFDNTYLTDLKTSRYPKNIG